MILQLPLTVSDVTFGRDLKIQYKHKQKIQNFKLNLQHASANLLFFKCVKRDAGGAPLLKNKDLTHEEFIKMTNEEKYEFIDLDDYRNKLAALEEKSHTASLAVNEYLKKQKKIKINK